MSTTDPTASTARGRLQILDLCLRVGEVLLSSGAGAADVTATMSSMAWHLGLRGVDVDVTFTSLSLAYQPPDPEEPPVSVRRTVQQRVIDYEHLTLVDHLIGSVLRDKLDVKQARTELGRITSSGHARQRWTITVGWGLMCAGVSLQFGGGPFVVALAFVAAASIDRAQLAMSRRRLPTFYQQVAGGGVAGLVAVAAAATPLELDASAVVTASIVMLLAGIGFMGALQDALTGFYVTAGARLTEAMLATSGIIAGVSGALSVAHLLGVALPAIDPRALGGVAEIAQLAVGSAVCAAGFAYASYAPLRILAPVAAVGALAVVLSEVIREAGVTHAWGIAIAALFVGLVSYTVSGRMRVPPLVVVVSAVVPMLPGLSIYRGLSLLAAGRNVDVSSGLLALITAASIASALAAGVILGEYLAQPIRREARRLESRLAGPRLVGPLRVRESRRSRRARIAEEE